MIARGAPGFFVLLAGAALLAGCESTQEKSAQIAAALGPVKERKGLEIDEESKDVKVVDTTLLSDENGTAVVVEVKNESDQTLVDVPIAVDVLDAKGKSVYSNDAAELDPALVSIPLLEPGETVDWVNDEVFPLGEAKEVEAKIGADASTFTEELPDIEVGEPKLQNDPVSGVNAAGTAINNTDVQQGRLVLFGVARQGDEIVAAGGGAIDKLNPQRQRAYHIYFIGDPEGAEISVTSFPTLASTEDEKGGSNG